jgi:hypothetical protein
MEAGRRATCGTSESIVLKSRSSPTDRISDWTVNPGALWPGGLETLSNTAARPAEISTDQGVTNDWRAIPSGDVAHRRGSMPRPHPLRRHPLQLSSLVDVPLLALVGQTAELNAGVRSPFPRPVGRELLAWRCLPQDRRSRCSDVPAPGGAFQVAAGTLADPANGDLPHQT